MHRPREERLRELEPNAEFSFLDPIWDKYLLGVAYRACTPPLPVYGFNAIKVAASELFPGDPGNAWGLVRKTTQYHNVCPAPILLKSYLPSDLHDVIKKSGMTVWDDRITRAVLGIGSRKNQPDSVVYSYWKTVELLEQSQAYSDLETPESAAIEFLEHQMIPVWQGDRTPYFVHTIN